jgi:hypothetical protein
VAELHEHYRNQFEARQFVLRYEKLASDPESTVRELLDYIGLPFEERCLRFHEERRFTATPSYRQVDSKISNRWVGRHRNYQHQLAKILPPE